MAQTLFSSYWITNSGMLKLITAIFLALLSLFFTSQSLAQTNAKVNKIPSDLLITLKRQEGWGGSRTETTITGDGDYSVKVSGGVRSVSLTELGLNKKPPKYLKPKVSEPKLRSLIAEFEKVRFFEFGKDFPKEDEKEHWSVTDSGTEVISIRINGQAKEVSNYLGDSLNRTRILRDLAERIRGAGIWNFENGHIPENFQVSYRVTGGDAIQRDFKIDSHGKIVESFYTSVPFEMQKGKFVPRFDRSKTVGKISKKQLRQLIDEFENVGFSAFRYSTLEKYDGCSNGPASPAEKRTHINVQIDRMAQMYASLYQNCDPIADSAAAKFEYMANVLEKLLKGVIKNTPRMSLKADTTELKQTSDRSSQN